MNLQVLRPHKIFIRYALRYLNQHYLFLILKYVTYMGNRLTLYVFLAGYVFRFLLIQKIWSTIST